MSARERRRCASAGRCTARSDTFVAWLVTGPLGHLWSALADMAIIWGRFLARRARRRISRGGG